MTTSLIQIRVKTIVINEGGEKFRSSQVDLEQDSLAMKCAVIFATRLTKERRASILERIQLIFYLLHATTGTQTHDLPYICWVTHFVYSFNIT